MHRDEHLKHTEARTTVGEVLDDDAGEGGRPRPGSSMLPGRESVVRHSRMLTALQPSCGDEHASRAPPTEPASRADPHGRARRRRLQGRSQGAAVAD